MHKSKEKKFSGQQTSLGSQGSLPETSVNPRLSTQQELLLLEISNFWSTYGRSPSANELAEKFGRTRQNIYQHLRNLKKMGVYTEGAAPTLLLEQHKNKETSQSKLLNTLQSAKPKLTSSKKHLSFRYVPILGQTAAGMPIFAEQYTDDGVWLEWTNSDPLFALRVRGRSMINIGIMDGDIIILRQQPTYSDGDIVLALIDGEDSTVKRLRREKDTIFLIPENDQMNTLVYHASQVLIQGKVLESRRIYGH